MSAALLNEFRESHENSPAAEVPSPLMARIGDRRWLLASSAALCAGLGVALCAHAKPKYEAKSVLLLPMEAQAASGAAALLGTGGPSPLDVLRGVAMSYSTQSRVQKKFGLTERELRDLLKVSDDADANQLVLTVTDDRPELSLGILQETIGSLEELNRDINFSAAARQANYLTATITEKEKALQASRRRLAAFQKRMQAPSDPSDPSSLLSIARQLQQSQVELEAADHELATVKRQAAQQAAASLTVGTGLQASDKWRSRVVEAEYQFKLAEQQFGPQNPEYLAAKRQLNVTQTAAKNEIAQNLRAIQSGVDPSVAATVVKRETLRWTVAALKRIAQKAPDEALTITALLQDVREREAVLQELKRRYENAQVDAQVDRVRWTLLEKPHLSEEPTNKSFVRQGALFGILGFLGMLVLPLRRRP